MPLAVPAIGATHQRHLNFIRNLEQAFVVRNANSSELELSVPISNMLVRLGMFSTHVPTITGTFRVVAILDPNFVRELDNLMLRMTVYSFILSYALHSHSIATGHL